MPDLLSLPGERRIRVLAPPAPAPILIALCECGDGPPERGRVVCARCAADLRCKSLRGELVGQVEHDAVIARRILWAMAAGAVLGFAIWSAFAL